MKSLVLAIVVTILLCLPVHTRADVSAAPDGIESAADPTAPKPPPPRIRKGLMIGGWATVGGGYILSLLGGLIAIQAHLEDPSGCSDCIDVGPFLLIPIAGPWIALPRAVDTPGKVLCGLLGATQAVGLVLAIPGTVMFTRDRERERKWRRGWVYGRDWVLSPIVAGSRDPGPGLQFGLRF